MTELNNPQAGNESQTEHGNPSAGTQNAEHTVSYSRFKEVNDAKKSAEERLAKFEAAETERKQAEALARGEHEQVINDLRPKAERAAVLEQTLNTYLELEIADIPEDKRDLIPDGDVAVRLEWVKKAKAKGMFGAAAAAIPNIGAGSTSDHAGAVPKQVQEKLAQAKAMGMPADQLAQMQAFLTKQSKQS